MRSSSRGTGVKDDGDDVRSSSSNIICSWASSLAASSLADSLVCVVAVSDADGSVLPSEGGVATLRLRLRFLPCDDMKREEVRRWLLMMLWTAFSWCVVDDLER